MRGLMMNVPLLVSSMIDYAADCHGSVEIVSREMDGEIRRYTYGEARQRCKRLAQGLIRLGVEPGEVVGGLAWNTRRYFECFYGVSGMGAVLHTLNPRLFPEQLIYIINHAEDKWLCVDRGTIELAEQLAPKLTTVQGYIWLDDTAARPAATSLPSLLDYEELLAAEDGRYEWPQFDENTASTICFTSGTTGHPKGVVYSHRAATLITMTGGSQEFMGGHGNGARECYMPVAPLFHGNGWMMPYTAPTSGSKLVLPGRNYEPDKLYELIEDEGVTMVAGVPTIWLMLVDFLRRSNRRFSTLRTALMSGAKPPRNLIETLEGEFGLDAAQVWGMTEALCAAQPGLKQGYDQLTGADRIDVKMRGGRIAFGTKYRIVDDDGNELPWDGKSTGDLLVRGPIVASGYLKDEGGIQGATGVKDGWLHTGDVACIHADGYVELADRSKDVIKSGGEWISSVEVENAAMGHPDVYEAAVIGVHHPKWQERPLLIVVRREGAEAGADEIRDWLRDKIASWWLPDDVVFIDELPHTATGKVHKLTLRERFAEYTLPQSEAS
ncbi:MAG: long-chain fatty acid--CoA ligase [Alphaproteobacteria bacterium]|jgi:fatty-acyl-CoA synthase|nr:long-chain fatty acid--CoA ligase [Alphaproteobacteria bacterium]MDP6814728.1 long-chain fatty acid--CoA ligase [Alphaproteobacteria bacterium]